MNKLSTDFHLSLQLNVYLGWGVTINELIRFDCFAPNLGVHSDDGGQ